MPAPTTDVDLALAAELAQQLRVDSIRSSTSAGSGHPTSSMSAADLMAVLVGRHLRYDWDDPGNAANDHLIFSKGHASPLLYSIFKAVGVVSDEELMTGYRRFGSRLEGHPTPVLPWVDVATGSLGQGLPDAVGVALAGKYLEELPYRVWVLCGDSEIAEGSIWEALDKAAYYKLSNLVAIIDINRLGQRGPTEHEWDTDVYRRRVTAFGARAFVIDGHDLAAIDRTLSEAGEGGGDQPTVILARTLKGRGFTEVEDKENWHGKPLPPEMAERAVIELGGERNLLVRGPVPDQATPRHPARDGGAAGIKLPAYDLGQKVATRKAYGDALAALGARPDVVAMDGEVSNSTFADEFAKAYPERYFEMFIAEQQLVAAAVGMGVRGYRPFASTFAAFFTRAYDFIRMAAISQASICLAGSHAGVEIGADGPSQMALEDLAMLRAVHGSTVLYPCDGTSAAALVVAMADLAGHLLHADHPGRLPGAVRRRGGLPGRRVQGAAPDRRRPGDPDRRRGHPARVPGRRRHAGRRRHQRPGHRPVLGQARRHRHAVRGRRGHRRPAGHRRGPPPRGRPRLRGPRRPDRRRPRRPGRRPPGRPRDARLRHPRRAPRRLRHRRRPHRRRRPPPARGRIGAAVPFEVN